MLSGSLTLNSLVRENEGYTPLSDIAFILRSKMEFSCIGLKRVTKVGFGTDVSIYWPFDYINFCQ